VVVHNVAPSSVAFQLSASTINEGQSVTLTGGSFTDPGLLDTHTVTVNWGDGSTPDVVNLAAGLTSFGALSHTYADNLPGDAPYAVRVTVTDKSGGSGSAGAQVVVHNVAPTAGLAGPSSGVRGQTLHFTLQAADPSPVDQAAGFTFKVCWGDGTTSTVSGLSGTGIDHVYKHKGDYVIQVTATDKDGGVSAFYKAPVSVTGNAKQGNTLVIGGTTDGDLIWVGAGSKPGQVWVYDNGTLQSFTNVSQLVIYGQGGDDWIRVARGLNLPTQVYGKNGASQNAPQLHESRDYDWLDQELEFLIDCQR
jgi:hypothetical protein